MKIAANDPRMNVISVSDTEILVQISGKIAGNLLVIATKDSKRILHRGDDGRFYGRNGRKAMIIVEV